MDHLPIMQKRFFVGFLFIVVLSTNTIAQIYPTSFTKMIASRNALLDPAPRAGASFGIESSAIGDLDDDGGVDFAVGATNQLGNWTGGVYICFMHQAGYVRKVTFIASSEPAEELDSFGSSLCALGDLDDDGVEDIGVGAGYDSDGAFQEGALWILFMNANGTVKGRQKISSLHGGFTAPLDERYVFGTGSSAVGDLDGDGNIEIAVGARYSGNVYILFLNNNGTVKKYTTISSSDGLAIDMNDGLFGYKVAGLGDVNGDGIPDVAIGGHRSDITRPDSGVVYVVFLNTSGTVKGFQTIAPGLAGFNDPGATLLGVGLVGIGDYDNDGVPDLVTGGTDLSDYTGAIWYLMLKPDGSVKSFHKISSLTNDTNLELHPGDFFGGSVSYLGDINSDGIPDLAIGAFLDDEDNNDSGAIWLTTPCTTETFAGDDVTVCSLQSVKMNATLLAGSTGLWTVVQGAGHIVDATDPDTMIENPGVGENIFRWTMKNTCSTATDDVKVTVEKALIPNAGIDQEVCEGTTSVNIAGTTSPIRTGLWKLLGGSGIITDSSSPSTTFQNPGVGINTLTWTYVEDDYCPATSDSVVIIVWARPAAGIDLPDSTYTCRKELSINGRESSGEGMWSVTEGLGELADPGQPSTIISFKEANKPLEVTWTVSNGKCPDVSKSAIIFPFDFNTEKIPNVITPNGDNDNEKWKIPDIQRVPNQIRLYNRWGKEVFNTYNYKNDWSGGDLSSGVYFFLINILGCDYEFKGWLNIVR